MNDNPNLAPRTLARIALALATVVAAAPLPAAESAINMKPASVLITEPNKTDSLTTVSVGQRVKIKCPVEIDGTAYQQFIGKSVFRGAPEWTMWPLTKTQGNIVFHAPLKILLSDGQLGIRDYPIEGKVLLNSTWVVDAPEAPPNYIGYKFSNAGYLLPVEAEWTFKTEGKHTVRCRVDSGQAIKETNEADNTKGVTVLVMGPVKQHVQPAPTIQAPPSVVLPPPPRDAVPARRTPRPRPDAPLTRPDPNAERVRLNPQPEPPSNEARRSRQLQEPPQPKEPPRP